MFHLHIKIGNRSIIQIFKHWIMKIDCDQIADCNSALKMVPVTSENKELLQGGTFNYAIMSAWTDRPEYGGWLFFDATGNRIGYIWVVYPGGDDIWYKIRKTDAYITDVFVYPEYRGHGYAVQMVSILLRELKKVGAHEAVLACRPYNTPAVKTYDRVGFKTVDEKIVVRICGKNIPYYTL